MNNALKAIIAGIIGILLYLCGRRGRVLDNRSGADAIRNGLKDGAERASDIARGIDEARSDNRDAGDAARRAGESIERADAAVGDALDLISKIRKRRQDKPDGAHGGSGSD